ncbi:hypothetical protein GCM10009741_48900 [Kribbella lupini]|uniref:Uncharacterized protein n=1 Tax=Kribbella lupini TaxID=291602 RepID=A0ABN2BIJ7_9ACTN
MGYAARGGPVTRVEPAARITRAAWIKRAPPRAQAECVASVAAMTRVVPAAWITRTAYVVWVAWGLTAGYDAGW